GRMLAFIRGPGTFTTAGQIYLKILPEGDAAALTSDGLAKTSPAFSPDGSRIAYTANGEGSAWSTWIVPTLRGEPRPWLPGASGLTWIGRSQLLYALAAPGVYAHMKLVTGREDAAETRLVLDPTFPSGMAHRSALSPDGRTVLVVEMGVNGQWLPCR